MEENPTEEKIRTGKKEEEISVNRGKKIWRKKIEFLTAAFERLRAHQWHRGRVVSGADLLRLNEKLKLIFQMCVLTEMGIPSDRFCRLRRQLATWIIDYV